MFFQKFLCTSIYVDFFLFSTLNNINLIYGFYFRLSLTLMIFVNYGGGGYWFFNHSLWNGITVADLVFPWFIFVMGTAIAIVFKNVHCRPMPKNYFLYRVIKRSITLFALGLFLNSASSKSSVFIE